MLDCNFFWHLLWFPGAERRISKLRKYRYRLFFPSLWIKFRQQTFLPFFSPKGLNAIYSTGYGRKSHKQWKLHLFPCLLVLYSDWLTTYIRVTYRLVLPAVHHGSRNHVPYKKNLTDWACCTCMSEQSMSLCSLNSATSNNKLIITSSNIDSPIHPDKLLWHQLKANWKKYIFDYSKYGVGLKLTNYRVQKGNTP